MPVQKNVGFLGIASSLTLFISACGQPPTVVGSNGSSSVSNVATGGEDPTHPNPTTTTATTPVVPVTPARASTAANLRVCAKSSNVPGADVSAYDPNTNWATFVHAGNGFAFVKATEGLNYTSSLFSTDWASIRKNGILRGAYHFFRPEDDPLKQAQFYLETVGAWDIQDLPPMLDWEVSDGVAVKTQINNALLWLQAVEAATGRTPIIYLSPSFFNSLGNPQGFARYPLFVAHYGVSCPSVPPPWSKWTFWQKNTGSVAGVQTNPADIDEFNGSLPSLQTFAAAASTK